MLSPEGSEGVHVAKGVVLKACDTKQRFVVGARKEVVICAGVIGSPQLLMLSGVGPSSHLEKFDIPVVQDLPAVGQNLLDVRIRRAVSRHLILLRLSVRI